MSHHLLLLFSPPGIPALYMFCPWAVHLQLVAVPSHPGVSAHSHPSKDKVFALVSIFLPTKLSDVERAAHQQSNSCDLEAVVYNHNHSLITHLEKETAATVSITNTRSLWDTFPFMDAGRMCPSMWMYESGGAPRGSSCRDIPQAMSMHVQPSTQL